MLTLFKGDKSKVARLEEVVAEELGFKNKLSSPGQVYPRSLDYALLSHLSQVAAASENFAKTVRIMAGVI